MASEETDRGDGGTTGSDGSSIVPGGTGDTGPLAAILGSGSEGATPGPDPPAPPSTADADVPRDLQASFWVLVIVANAAIMALAVGGMFVAILGDWRLGGQLLVVGLGLSAYGYYRYRGVAARKDALAAQSEEDDPEGTTETDDDARTSGTDGTARSTGTGDGPDAGETASGSPESGVSDAVRQVATAVHDDRSLELLVAVVDRQPVGVRTLLAETDLCESDLHGTLAEFQAAGLVEETEVAGERGYRATGTAVEGVAVLREDD